MLDTTKLKAPFPSDRVSWRVGPTTKDKTRGFALCYIDARDVAERLDEVCGPENWENDYPHANSKTVCSIRIWTGERWVAKANGAGDTDREAEKGALSDAFKRAATMWGIGRYLYDIPGQWVDLDDKGNIKPDQFPKLARVLEGLAQPQLRGLERATSNAAADLMIELRKEPTLAALHIWKSSTKVRERYVALDADNKAKVNAAYVEHQDKLQKQAAAA
jgi:hypothetical protein